MKCSEIKGSHQNSSLSNCFTTCYTQGYLHLLYLDVVEYSIAPHSPLMVEIFLLRKLANTTLSGSSLLLLLFWPVIWLARPWFPNQGSNACPYSRSAEA